MISEAGMAWMGEALRELVLDSFSEMYVQSRGVNTQLIQKLGLVTWQCPSTPCPDDTGRFLYGPYGERLEGRLMMPWFSPSGSLVSFESRPPFEKDLLKIQGPSARWIPVWAGMPFSMPEIARQRRVVLVEGFFDAVPFWRNFPTTPVLACGTSKLSWNQRRFLLRWVREVIVIFDHDDAGISGVEQVRKAMGQEVAVRPFCTFGQVGEDPSSFWARVGDHGFLQEFAMVA